MLREQVSCLRREEAILKDFLASLATVQENKEDQEGGGNLAYDSDNLVGAREVCVCVCPVLETRVASSSGNWLMICFFSFSSLTPLQAIGIEASTLDNRICKLLEDRLRMADEEKELWVEADRLEANCLEFIDKVRVVVVL